MRPIDVQEYLDDTGLSYIRGLAREGLTRREIASKLNISYSTLNRWIKQYPDFKRAMRVGRDMSDSKVEESLYKRACGFQTVEIVEDYKTDPATGDQVLVGSKKIIKDIPPDTTAQIYWLKNRQRDKWKDKWEIQVTGAEEEQSKLTELLEQRKERRKGEAVCE